MAHDLRSAITMGARVGLLFSIPALLAWLTGRPLVFPSLGPTALALFLQPPGKRSSREVLGGHLIGLLAGLVSYHVLASGIAVTDLPPALSIAGLRLALSGILSIVLTTAFMIRATAVHTPACATTLIVSLGLLPSWQDGAVIMLSVAIMFAASRMIPIRRNVENQH